MAMQKTSIRLESDLWTAIKGAARAWAERQGIPGERVASLWVARALRRAVAEESGAGEQNRD